MSTPNSAASALVLSPAFIRSTAARQNSRPFFLTPFTFATRSSFPAKCAFFHCPIFGVQDTTPAFRSVISVLISGKTCISDHGDDRGPRKARSLAFWGGMTRDVVDSGDLPPPGSSQIGVGYRGSES